MPAVDIAAAFDDVGAAYDAARCVLLQSRLAGGKGAARGRAGARSVELAEAAQRALDAMGATALEA